MLTLLLVFCLGSLLTAALSLPLLAGKVKPNGFYGFRVRQTLENPEVRYAANRYFAKRQLAVGLLEGAAAVGLYFWPGISLDAYALACLGVFVVLFGIAIVQGFRYMKSLGR
jgi:hypothetical protein